MALMRENLNRKIAGTNGVVLNQRNTWLDAALAANLWAGTTGLDIVGALNQKAGLGTRSPANFRDLMGVANELAGTSGLDVDLASDLW
jgi:hypothetical protein